VYVLTAELLPPRLSAMSVAAVHPPGRNRWLVLRLKSKGFQTIEFIHLFLLAEDCKGTKLYVLTEHQFHHHSSDGRTGLFPVNPLQEETGLILFRDSHSRLRCRETRGQRRIFL